MNRYAFRILLMCLGLWCGLSEGRTAFGASPSESLLMYDRGAKGGERLFADAAACRAQPCVVTQHGAIRFAPAVAKEYDVILGSIHDGSYRSIPFFQQSTTLEQKLGERLLNRTPNRKIVNLARLIAEGETETLYLYGVGLQHDLDEGDAIIVTLTRRKAPSQVEEYFFRYHRAGIRPDLDLAFLFPVNVFWPNPGGTVQSAQGGMALSFSIGSHLDPERHHGWMRKTLHAVRLNLFSGVVARQVLDTIANDRVIRNNVDGFVGMGVTAFDFLIAGYGINVIRAPRVGFPFVGIEVGHTIEFIKSLKRDTHSQWEKYLKAEQRRSASVE